MGKVQSFNFNVSNLKKQEVPPRKIDTSDSIIAWEVSGGGTTNRNNFPQQLLANVYNSPVGAAALDIWSEFLEGDGFVDPECDKIKINKEGETLANLHAQVSADMAFLWGFAVHVSYDSQGRKTELKHMPFESTRLGVIDPKTGEVKDIRYNPYFGIPQDKYTSETRVYYPYNPDPAHVMAEMKRHAALREKDKVKYVYPGQVFWFSVERPLARVYPQPFYYSSINWFKIDAKIQDFHERNIDNNFLLSVLINMYGNPDQPAGGESEDDDGNKKDQYETVGEVFNKHMKDHFAGSKNGGSALVNWFMDEVEKADIDKFPTNSHHELFTTLQKLTTDQICIGTKTPPVLLSIREAGKLGDTQELINSVRVMQSRVNRLQRHLKNQYSKLLSGFKQAENKNFSIKNLNPFNILPQWAINELTSVERRTYINEHFPIQLENIELPPAESQPGDTTAQTNDALRNLTGRQMQNIQRIVRKYNKEEITYDQAAQMLREGYAMSEDAIDIWLVKSEEDDNDLPN